MINYEDMSNAELDILVTEKLGGFTSEDYSSISGNYHKGVPSDSGYRVGVVRNYTGDWSVMGSIIQEYAIDLQHPEEDLCDMGQASKYVKGDTDIFVEYTDKKDTLRAAAIVFLMMDI